MTPSNWFHKWFFLKLLLTALLFLSGCSGVSKDKVWKQKEPLLVQNKIAVCYDYSCKKVGQVELAGTQWNRVVKLFESKAQTPQEERQKIASAIALMEQFTGERLGTSNDQARNSGTGESGQMDCIDESKNTTAYIGLFESRGWIKWHQLQDRVNRSYFFLDIHWTAVIKEKQSKQLYAVDSWFRDNGKEPVILKLQDWKLKREEP